MLAITPFQSGMRSAAPRSFALHSNDNLKLTIFSSSIPLLYRALHSTAYSHLTRLIRAVNTVSVIVMILY